MLQGSADIGELIDAFVGGADRRAIQSRLRVRLPEVSNFVDVLCQQRCLVPAGADELAELSAAYPLQARWALVIEETGRPIEAVQGRSTGVEPIRVVFSERQASIWRRIDGERSLADIARELVSAADTPCAEAEDETGKRYADALWEVTRTVAFFTHSERQWTRCSPVPASSYGPGRPRPPYLESTMPFARLDPGQRPPDDPFTRAGVVDLRRYHRDEITDADEQFELGETTLSHMFGVPHPALGGRTYAGALVDALIDAGMLADGDGPLAILEVGGGTGRFAAGMLAALRDRCGADLADLSYAVADLSPALQRAQREALAGAGVRTRCLTLDAEELPLPDASVDLLICNEVVADLRTARLVRGVEAGESWSEGSAAEAVEIVHRYELPVDDAPERFWLNLGAVRFLERVAAVLRPGGHAFVSEFGDLRRYPVESTQLDHPEFSIHFGHLLHVAGRLGLQAEVVSVPAFLGLEPEVPVLVATRTWFRNLRWWLGRRGVRLGKIALTPRMLRDVCRGRADPNAIPSLRFGPAGDRSLGLRPQEFKALLLHRPPRGCGKQRIPLRRLGPDESVRNTPCQERNQGVGTTGRRRSDGGRGCGPRGRPEPVAARHDR